MLDVGICYTWYDVGEQFNSQLRPQLPSPGRIIIVAHAQGLLNLASIGFVRIVIIWRKYYGVHA